MPAGHALAGEPRARLADAAREPLIVYDPGSFDTEDLPPQPVQLYLLRDPDGRNPAAHALVAAVLARASTAV